MASHFNPLVLFGAINPSPKLYKFGDVARPSMTLTELVALLGLISGVTGTVLGVFNFLRDRATVEVSLQWDMSVTPGTELDPHKLWGVITVTNVGRRPIFVSHAAIRLPKRAVKAGGYSHLVVHGGIVGKSLTEGSPSERYVVTQDGLHKYAAYWRDLVAQVNDSTGRVWRSSRLRSDQVPSWAQQGSVPKKPEDLGR